MFEWTFLIDFEEGKCYKWLSVQKKTHQFLNHHNVVVVGVFVTTDAFIYKIFDIRIRVLWRFVVKTMLIWNIYVCLLLSTIYDC